MHRGSTSKKRLHLSDEVILNLLRYTLASIARRGLATQGDIDLLKMLLFHDKPQQNVA